MMDTFTEPGDLAVGDRRQPLFGDRAFAAVLFDMDGTLTDSASSVERSWSLWGQRRGMRQEEILLTHGVPARQILATMLAPDEVDAELAVIERMEIDDCDEVVALPGAVEALQVLGRRCAIVTSCTRELFLARSAAAGLAAPGVVVTASDVEIGKPDPAPFLLAARRLGVDPAHCLVIEDAPAGLAAGRAAGCATLAVTTTHNAGELEAEVVVAGLNEVNFQIVDDRVIVRRTKL